jgi:GNAT superfamily N-acetyltransferase
METQPFEIALHTERPIDARDVRALYDSAGWWPNRSTEAIAKVLTQDPAIGAWEGDRLVAFARAITDGTFRAYIEDVVVHPDYRRQGIAIRMMQRLLGALEHIDVISLFCEADLVSLYGFTGFKAQKSQVVMHREKSAAPSTGGAS